MSKKKVWERIGHDRVSYLNQLVRTLHLRTSTRKIARQNFNSNNILQNENEAGLRNVNK